MPKKQKKPAECLCYMNAYAVRRKAPRPGPDVRVVNHGTVLGSLSYRSGNAYEKKKAMRLLAERYGDVVREDGLIYKKPTAVALWIYQEGHPAEDWVDEEE
jgi:hypothetical protein